MIGAKVRTERAEPEAGREVVHRLRSDVAVERELAWRELYDANYRRVYRLVCRFGVPPAEVEDLVQRAFLVAFDRLRETGDVRDPGAWLCGIVVRLVAQHRRWRRVREAKRWLLRQAPASAPAPVMTPERSAESAQQSAEVRAVLDRMSGKLRDVLVLCDIEELPPREAAAILGVSVNTVRSRRRLAKEKFMRLWTARHGGGEA